MWKLNVDIYNIRFFARHDSSNFIHFDLPLTTTIAQVYTIVFLSQDFFKSRDLKILDINQILITS